MKRVYVAGSYSAPNVLAVMGNIRRGLDLSAKALKAGFAVYSPWTDCLLHFREEFTIEQCYEYSMPWLRASDAVLVVQQGFTESRGTQQELLEANELGIPVFFDLESLVKWRDENASV